MRKHEYLTVRVPAGKKAQTRELNNYAQAGWEVESMAHIIGQSTDKVTLRRPWVEKPAAPHPFLVLAAFIGRKLVRR